ncbi:Ig-like domain-containing protein [Capilliphycus salinus ALCB114379]|uniref:Ig-like domain-containing protein n=1 Tax=Capilliphycus salinus TaxID=2768948 RepID=UPI0039A44A43
MIEINGTPGNDNLLGTGEADVIFALTGNDRISGSSGGDSLFGFEGNDTINGNEGNDTLFGNQNLDLLFGDSGEDWLFGGKEADIIEDGEGEDQVFGNLGDDLLRGGAGNDQRYGGQANDTVIGGIGNDRVFGDRGNDILWGVDVDAVNPGIDEIDTLTGGSEQDIFVLGDESRLYYIGFGNNDFALITDFNVVEDQINVGNNQVIYTETVLNELGFGVAISSQNNDLIAFVQNANVSQFLESSNVVEPPQTEEVIPRQIEEPQFPEAVLSPDPVVTPTPTPDPVVTPTPTPDPVVTPTPTPDPVVTPTPTPVVITPTPTPDPVVTPTPTPDPVVTPTPTPDPVTPTPTPVVITPTPTPDPVTPTPTPVVITPTPTPDPVTPTPTPDPVTPTPTPDPVTPTPTPDPVTPTPTPVVITPTPTPDPVTPTPTPVVITPTPTPDPITPTPTPVVITPTPTPDPITPTPTPDPELPPNTLPVANNDSYTTPFDSPISVNSVPSVLNNDTDLDGDVLTAILVNQSINTGFVTLNPDGSFSYDKPNPEFWGEHTFTYVANDGKSDSNNIATVTINVEEPPVEQTRHRNGYSHRSEDQAQVFRTFFITNVGNNDEIINDQNDSDIIGLFPEAIQNFIAYETMGDGGLSTVITLGSRSFDYSDDRGRINFKKETQILNFDNDGNILSGDKYATLSFDEKEGVPIFTGLNIDIEDITPVDLDLRVRLVEKNDIINELDLTDAQANPIVKLEDSFKKEIIVYEFLESGTDKVVEELVLSTDFPNTDLPNKPINYNLATNSLEYIIKQNLLLHTEEKSSFTLRFLFNDENIISKDDVENKREELYRNANNSLEFIMLEEAELPPPEEQTYSQRDDETTVLTTFLLTNNGDNYQTIDDQDDSDTRSLFPEAIQDFITYNNNNGIQLAADEYDSTPRINFNRETELFEEGTTLSFNDEGEPIFTGVEVETEITPVVDLRVSKLIERDDIITELELPDDTEIDDSFPGEIIVYEFLETGTETVLEEQKLFLFTNEFPDLELEESVFTDDSLEQSDKINLATNSLESIIEEDLLSFALKENDAIQVILGELTLDEARSNGESFVNPED